MKKILVIDDEQPTLMMFRLFLDAYGYEALTAENGESGIELFQKERPAIVITDIKMPGMDGLAVLQKIKELAPETEVIVVTGHGDMELALEALNLQATDFINKPIHKSALDAALRRAEERIQMAKSKVDHLIDVRRLKDVSVLEIQGNVSSLSEALLFQTYENLSEEGVKKYIIHFDENCSISGTGIAVVIQLISNSVKKGQQVAITGVRDHFKRIFDMVGITKMAPFFESEEEAVKGLNRSG